MIRRRCRIRWCRRWFDSPSEELLFCPLCRQRLLEAEDKLNAYGKKMNREAVLTTERLQADFRSVYDYRIIDETGREVWASELIKRYKGETKPRAV